MDAPTGGVEQKQTEAQKQALKKLLEELKQRYPRALVLGHHDLNRYKPCPCFDAKAEYGGRDY